MYSSIPGWSVNLSLAVIAIKPCESHYITKFTVKNISFPYQPTEQPRFRTCSALGGGFKTFTEQFYFFCGHCRYNLLSIPDKYSVEIDTDDTPNECCKYAVYITYV